VHAPEEFRVVKDRDIPLPSAGDFRPHPFGDGGAADIDYEKEIVM